jgi:hypothetical protein
VLSGKHALIWEGEVHARTASRKRLIASRRSAQWFRYLPGLLDVTGALLVLMPRWSCYGDLSGIDR